MTNLTWMILLAGVSVGITMVCGLLGFGFLCVAAITLAYILGAMCDYKSDKINHPVAGRITCIASAFFGIVFCLIAAFVPTEKSLYMAAGVETVNEFSKTETAKELGQDGMNIVHDITKIIHNYAEGKTKGE